MARSTGATTKTAARAYCRELQKQSKLIRQPDGPRFGPTTFAAFARDFWTWNKSLYIEAHLRFSRPQRPAVSWRNADDMASALRRHIIPVFGRRRLDSITPTLRGNVRSETGGSVMVFTDEDIEQLRRRPKPGRPHLRKKPAGSR